MRNSTSGSTPKTTNTSVQDESASNSNASGKSSAKKLKQARLPFKIIAPVTSPVVSKTATPLSAADESSHELRNDFVTDQPTTETRKRKLSNEDDEDECVIVSGGDTNVSKENVEISAAAVKKKKISEILPVVISLLGDGDKNEGSNEDMANVCASQVIDKEESASKTPKAIGKNKRKGAGTPQSSNVQKDKTGSTSKLQIKLPLSSGKKNKRKKSNLQQLNHSISATEEAPINTVQDLSSDIEEVALELNPQKRQKLNEDCNEKENKTDKDVETLTMGTELGAPNEKVEDEQEKLNDDLNNSKEVTKGLSEKETLESKSLNKFFQQNDQKNKTHTSKIANNKLKQVETKEIVITSNKNSSTIKCSDKNEGTVKDLESSNEIKDSIEKLDLYVSTQSDNDNEADDERDHITAKAILISSDTIEDVKTKSNTIEDGHNKNATEKTQTPKQTKLTEQRRKAREEKERKLQEEKMKKQQEKEEKELAKKREREEKEEQKRKEREEREEQKRKEREEKERKRLAELEAKNEEKRKKNEAKEEELRKKEEERKKKEQEKEEAELKKKKAAQAFTKFFVAKTPTGNQLKNDEDSNTGDSTKLLAFRPFQVKGDMKLAPICRKIFTLDDKSRLDNLLGFTHKTGEKENDNGSEYDDIVRRKPLTKLQLYLSELQSGKILPGKWRRPSTESKDDVIIVEDELERAGQAIVEDTPAYVREHMRVKFYKFHDNRRPPYYGTWRKKSSVVKSRRPFAQDKKMFDYEVDSDDEWEEEEPGESLEDGSDDDKEKESEDDDYEVDNEWFVPHGHLSDEELQNEDEYGMGDDNTREAQKVKLQILQQEFAQEMKKKTEKIKPRLIGCIWADINGNQPSDCANILWDALEKKAMLLTDYPIVEELETEKSGDPISPSSTVSGNQEKSTVDKLKPITLTDNMIKDLTRLIHGNNHSKNFLINEYIAYIEQTEESVKNGDLRKPLKSVIRDKIDEIAEWQIVDATASTIQDMEQNNDDSTENNKKKKKGKRRLCWVVKQEMLDKMNLSSLKLKNSWQYILPPKFVKAEKDVKTEETVVGGTKSEFISTPTSDIIEHTEKEKERRSRCGKALPAEEKTKKIQNNSSANSNQQSEKTTAETKCNFVSPSHQNSKDKKRVPLLMSVARGQQISTPVKNKLISQFLQQKGDNKEKTQKLSSPTTSRGSKTKTMSPTVEDDDTVILD